MECILSLFGVVSLPRKGLTKYTHDNSIICQGKISHRRFLMYKGDNNISPFSNLGDGTYGEDC